MAKMSFSFHMLVHAIPKYSDTYKHVRIHRITVESKTDIRKK